MQQSNDIRAVIPLHPAAVIEYAKQVWNGSHGDVTEYERVILPHDFRNQAMALIERYPCPAVIGGHTPFADTPAPKLLPPPGV
jgi:hypothetical protein